MSLILFNTSVMLLCYNKKVCKILHFISFSVYQLIQQKIEKKNGDNFNKSYINAYLQSFGKLSLDNHVRPGNREKAKFKLKFQVNAKLETR